MKRFPIRRIQVLEGHQGPVHAVAYSSGAATYVLTGCDDRLIRLYNPSRLDGSLPIQTFRGHGYEVLDLAVTNDNSKFASCGGDRDVLLWDVPHAQILRRLGSLTRGVNAVAWAGVGETVLVSAYSDATVKLWDMKSNSTKPLMTLSEAKDSVYCVAAMEHQIATGSVDGRLRVYDMRYGQVFVDVIGPPITSITPTSDNAAILVSSLDSTLRLMDKSNGQLLRAYKSDHYTNMEYRVRSTISSQDGQVLAGSEDGRIIAWELMTGEVVTEIWHAKEAENDRNLPAKGSKKTTVSAVTWCPTRPEWCSGGGDGKAIVWGM